MGYDLTFDTDRVLHFVLVFSRLEYAMKRAGFLMKGKRSAEADWDSFAQSIRLALKQGASQDFERACSYMRMHPPARQINVNGALEWEPISRGKGQADEAYLLRAVRVVRNNLFHGGKYPTGSEKSRLRRCKGPTHSLGSHLNRDLRSLLSGP
jgi:hypothetical protein